MRLISHYRSIGNEMEEEFSVRHKIFYALQAVHKMITNLDLHWINVRSVIDEFPECQNVLLTYRSVSRKSWCWDDSSWGSGGVWHDVIDGCFSASMEGGGLLMTEWQSSMDITTSEAGSAEAVETAKVEWNHQWFMMLIIRRRNTSENWKLKWLTWVSRSRCQAWKLCDFRKRRVSTPGLKIEVDLPTPLDTVLETWMRGEWKGNF